MPPNSRLTDPGVPDPAGLRLSLEGVLLEVRNFRREVEEAQALAVDRQTELEKRRQRDNMIGIGVATGFAIAIVFLLVLTSKAFSTGNDAAHSAADAKRAAERIESCTTPTGQCYLDSSKRTSGTVANLIKAQVAVAECARSTDTDAQLEACVARKLRPIPVPTTKP